MNPKTFLTWSAVIIFAVSVRAFSDCKTADPEMRMVSSWEFPFGANGAYLGVDLRDVTSDRLAALKLKEERGVEITMVDQDAPAGKAGLKEHDVILTLNGTEVESVEQLRRMIHETPAGRTVTLGLSRSGSPMTVKVQLADRSKAMDYAFAPQQFKMAIPAIPAVPAMPAFPAMDMSEMDIPNIVVVHSSTRGGLMVENLTPQLGEYFGVKNGLGVLVRSVEKGSPAEKAGFHAGDVIVRIGNEPVTDASDWRHAMHSHRTESVPITIVRERKNQTLTLSLPKQTGRTEAMWESPDLSARVDLDEVQAQMQELQPQIQRAIRIQTEVMKNNYEKIRVNAEREAQRAMRQWRREHEQQEKDLEKWQQDFQEKMQKLDDEL